jgi:hypothetical protein
MYACRQSVAPYNSVYRPAQSFKALTAGNGTEAGDGGSRGVWTLTVTDKAEGDASRYERLGFKQQPRAVQGAACALYLHIEGAGRGVEVDCGR